MSDIATIKDILSAIEVSEDGKAQFLDTALTSALSEAASATDKYGKDSSITITISVESLEHNKVAISAKIAKKVAKGVTTPVGLYLNRKKELSFENPYQPKLSGFDDDETMRN